jgi:N-acetylmuramoyl-L-alanine amidase
MAKFKVAIDAGHAGLGVTPGKRTPDNEYEWNFNNKVALACISKLKANGVDVVRTDDPSGRTDVGLTARTNKANNAGADVMVSFHHNANTGRWGSWTGTETFTYLGSWPDAERLAREVQNRIVKAYGLRDRGLKKANFAIVRQSKMPSILVEGGYMDSTIDIKKMRNDKVLENAGIAAAEGILAYLGASSSKGGKAETVKVEKAPATSTKSSTTSSRSYLQKGDSGSKVKSMQQKLLKAGYKLPKYGADGDYGDETVTAVKAMQKANGIGVDGLYGSQSAKALDAEIARESGSSSSNIKVGSKVTLQGHATHYQTGESIPSSIKNKRYTVMQIKNVNKSNSKKAYLLKEIMSWVLEQDVKPKGSTASKPATKKTTPKKSSSGGGSAIVPYPGHYIKVGSKGKDVKRVQRAVGVNADGIFGNGTKSAVMAYQKRHGLGVDGIVGKETWNKMF